jgi:phospholipid/cholesterol/gamma-HCH transport system permease protein
MLRLGFIPFSYYVIADCFDFYSHKSISAEVLFKQIRFTGLEALSLIFTISFVLSVLIIAQGYPILTSIGQQALIYDILIVSIVRDGGPFIVCFIVLARSGTAITTELGNMVVAKEMDALNAMGISLISYLVVPRVLGMFFSVILLMSYFVLAGTISSFLTVSLFNHMPLVRFISELLNQLTLVDLIIMFAKVVLCGLLVALISCFHGLKVNKATTEVPQRNIKAVGQSLTIICIVHLVLSSTLLIDLGVL